MLSGSLAPESYDTLRVSLLTSISCHHSIVALRNVLFAELFLELHSVHCKASLQFSTQACHQAGRTSAALPADVQVPVMHSTASLGLAISVLSQQDCLSALVAAAQQGSEPCSCQDGISQSQVTSCNLVA